MRRLVISVTATVLTMLGLLAWKAGATTKSAAARAMSNVAVRTGTGAGGNGTTVVTGPQIVLAHGIVQVRATIANGRIIDVTALSLPHDNPHSYDESTAAAVKLRTEVLTKQSANVDIVSGATYTSHGYLSSLQAALDAAGRH